MRRSICSHIISSTAMLAVVLALATSAGLLLFSTFVAYDDEGYVILSLRNFSNYGGLYDRVYTQYGPAFFLINEAIRSLLRMEWTSDAARVLTLLNWMGTAICCELIVIDRTRSKLLGAIALSLTFIYLVYNIPEPGHPGSMLALLVSFVGLIGSKWDVAANPAAAAAVGVVSAVAALIKVNVGAFLFIAAVFWILLRAHSGEGWRKRIILYLSLIMLPWVLMGSTPMGLQSVLHFAILLNVSMFGIFAAIETAPQKPMRSNALTALIFGSLSISIILLILIVLRGTTLSGLISGVIFDPIKHPAINFQPVWLGPFWMVVASAALTIALGFYFYPLSKFFHQVIIFGRLLGIAVSVAAAVLKPSSVAFIGMSYGLSLLAICSFPLSRDGAAIGDARVRQWIAILLVLQSLHAYPVAGSQVSWGTFLLVPLVVIAINEAWSSSVLAPLIPSAIIRSLVAGLLAILVARMLVGGVVKFDKGESLGLPGAEFLSLPIDRVLAFRTISENARAHATQLFSVPGIFSFNLWTGLPTPTLANATRWHTMLNYRAQDEIMERLESDPLAAIVRQEGVIFQGALAAYIDRKFEPAFGVNGYEFLVHRGRRIAPLFISTIRPKPANPKYSLLSVTLGKLIDPITSIEIWHVRSSTSRMIPTWLGDIFPSRPELRRSLLTRLDDESGSVRLTQLKEDGTPSGETQPSRWPVRTQSTITLLEGCFEARFLRPGDLFVLIRSADRTIALAPIQR